MKIIDLYKYKRKNGGITVSPEKPDAGLSYARMYRVIAGEGMLVTRNGKEGYAVIDTDKDEGWYEVEDPFFEQKNNGQ